MPKPWTRDRERVEQLQERAAVAEHQLANCRSTLVELAARVATLEAAGAKRPTPTPRPPSTPTPRKQKKVV